MLLVLYTHLLKLKMLLILHRKNLNALVRVYYTYILYLNSNILYVISGCCLEKNVTINCFIISNIYIVKYYIIIHRNMVILVILLILLVVHNKEE